MPLPYRGRRSTRPGGGGATVARDGGDERELLVLVAQVGPLDLAVHRRAGHPGGEVAPVLAGHDRAAGLVRAGRDHAQAGLDELVAGGQHPLVPGRRARLDDQHEDAGGRAGQPDEVGLASAVSSPSTYETVTTSARRRGEAAELGVPPGGRAQRRAGCAVLASRSPSARAAGTWSTTVTAARPGYASATAQAAAPVPPPRSSRLVGRQPRRPAGNLRQGGADGGVRGGHPVGGVRRDVDRAGQDRCRAAVRRYGSAPIRVSTAAASCGAGMPAVARSSASRRSGGTCTAPILPAVAQVVAVGPAARCRTAHSAASVRDVEPGLAQQVGHMRVDRADRDAERARHLLVRHPGGQAGQHLAFAGGELPVPRPGHATPPPARSADVSRGAGPQLRAAHVRRQRLTDQRLRPAGRRPSPAAHAGSTGCRRSAPTRLRRHRRPRGPGRPGPAGRRRRAPSSGPRCCRTPPGAPDEPGQGPGRQLRRHGGVGQLAGDEDQDGQVGRGGELADQVEARRVVRVQVLDDQHGRAVADQRADRAHRHPQQRRRREPLALAPPGSAPARPAPPPGRATRPDPPR